MVTGYRISELAQDTADELCYTISYNLYIKLVLVDGYCYSVSELVKYKFDKVPQINSGLISCEYIDLYCTHKKLTLACISI